MWCSRPRRLGTRERLHLVAGNALEQIAALAPQRPFDLISISNIADWMSAAQFAEAMLLARECLAPGGAVLARTATGSPMIVEVMRKYLGVDDALNAALPRIERGPWFRVVNAGFKPA